MTKQQELNKTLQLQDAITDRVCAIGNTENPSDQARVKFGLEEIDRLQKVIDKLRDEVLIEILCCITEPVPDPRVKLKDILDEKRLIWAWMEEIGSSTAYEDVLSYTKAVNRWENLVKEEVSVRDEIYKVLGQ